MGVFARAFKPRNQDGPVVASLGGLPFPSGGSSAASNYQAAVRAYTGNEIVSAALDLLATSTAEPHIIGRRWRRNRPVRSGNTVTNWTGSIDRDTARQQIQSERRFYSSLGVPNRAGRLMVDALMARNGFWEEVDTHPLVHLVNNPNPWQSRGQFWASIVVDYYLAGNAYVLKARYNTGLLAGAVGELWRLRPDRMKVVKGDMSKGEPFVKAYEYSVDGMSRTIPASDIMHFRYPHNPLDPYYGASPLMALLPRVSIDSYMRTFLSTFYERGGAGVGANLNVKNGNMTQEEKDVLRDRFRRMFYGGQYDILISAADDVTYTPFGLNRGLRDALPKEIDAVNEARIAMVLRIPGSILGLLIGYESSSYANKRQDWQVFWDMTMTPMLSDLDDVLNLSLVPEFEGIDELLFDLSDIHALQEDEDKLQDRARKNFQVGGMSLTDFLLATGQNPTPDPESLWFVPGSSFVTPFKSLAEENTRKHAVQGSDEGGGPENLVTTARMLMQPPSLHPRIEDDPGARAVYEQAMALRSAHHGMTWEQIASRVGVAERTLRKYRAIFDDTDD